MCYNLAVLGLNGPLPCVDFMEVTMVGLPEKVTHQDDQEKVGHNGVLEVFTI